MLEQITKFKLKQLTTITASVFTSSIVTSGIVATSILLLSACTIPCGNSNKSANNMITPSNQTERIPTGQKLRIATFNVSMEALNYIPYVKDQQPKVTGKELTQALKSDHQQIKNIAEIIQRINPDILLLNEFDRTDNNHNNLALFIKNYLNKSQNGQQVIDFPYFYQGSVNTGVKVNADINHDGKINQQPADTHGFGYFTGHFGMVLLSKYPLADEKIRTFQHFKWQDMPNALKPIDPKTNKSWFSDNAWQQLRLSSKSHWDIPVNVQGNIIHVLASHPTPPVFDGEENRNGKRNHDEIRFWSDYINGDQGNYIYDDNNQKGSLAPKQRFILLGDQNASSVEGAAIPEGIATFLNDEKTQDTKPASEGAANHDLENPYAMNHTAYWGMRADYVVPSTLGFNVIDSGIFWPLPHEETFRLIKNRQASSDHRLVWVDVEIAPINKND